MMIIHIHMLATLITFLNKKKRQSSSAWGSYHVGFGEGRLTLSYPASGESVSKFEILIVRSQDNNLTITPRLDTPDAPVFTFFVKGSINELIFNVLYF